MDTKQLYQVCKADEHVKRSFIGVFASDKLPNDVPYPCSFIANTKPSNHKGEHWIAVHVDPEGIGTYFCSYGSPPSNDFIRVLNQICSQWDCTNKRLQAPLTATCGQYCVCFLHFRNRNVKPVKFLSLFSRDLNDNDTTVVTFVNALYDKNTKVYDNEFTANQVATLFK